jgi:hypothetical protein
VIALTEEQLSKPGGRRSRKPRSNRTRKCFLVERTCAVDITRAGGKLGLEKSGRTDAEIELISPGC